MNDTLPKIKFYTLEQSRLHHISNSINLNEVDTLKEVKTSTEYNEALISVIKKDINELDVSLQKIVGEINKILARNGITQDIPINTDIDKIEVTLNDVDEAVSNLIIKKAECKTGLFARLKKQNKKNIESIEDSLNSINKFQNDIIGLKNEYEKLTERLDGINTVSNADSKPDEDPLERTINFYMNK